MVIMNKRDDLIRDADKLKSTTLRKSNTLSIYRDVATVTVEGVSELEKRSVMAVWLIIDASR